MWAHGNGVNFFNDFKTFPPSVVIDSNLKIGWQGSGTAACDKYGNYIFSTRGCQIEDRFGKVMEGGDKLNEGPLADYNCKVNYNSYYPIYQKFFTLPGLDSTYHLLHVRAKWPFTNDQCQETDLLRSIIDMKQNQGLGRVNKINEVVFKGCIETVTANKHANGRDWWVLVGANNEDRFDRFLLHPDGSFEGPWIQTIAHPARNKWQFGGSALFSPDGSKFVIYHGNVGLAIYDFDRCSGLLSNLRFEARMPTSGYGAGISPNNRYLYIADTNHGETITQYDLWADDVIASKITAAVWNGKKVINTPAKFSFIQHGPDGKIYIWGGGTQYLHVMDFPNKHGEACQLRQQAIELPSTAFPTFYYPNYRLGPLDGSPCDTLGLDNHPVAEFRYDTYDSTKIRALQFTDVSWYEPAYWRWDFGDPASGTANKSTEQNPEHEFSKAGGYKVCLIAGNQYASDTICKQVWVGVSGIHTLPALPQARVSPNPATDHLRLSLPALLPAHTLRFTLTDVQGRVLREVQLNDFETDIALTDLPKGLYFWFLKVDGEVVQSGKIVKVEADR